MKNILMTNKLKAILDSKILKTHLMISAQMRSEHLRARPPFFSATCESHDFFFYMRIGTLAIIIIIISIIIIFTN